jgi:mTERF domain-containing protein
MMMMCKQLRTNELPLSRSMHLLRSLAFALAVKPHKTFANFCTQIVSPSATPHRGVVTEFLVNKCGLAQEEIAKAFRHSNRFLSAKSTQNLEEVLELLKGCGLTTPAQFRRVVLCNPKFLFIRSEINLKSKFGFLRTFMEEEDISKLVITHARIFDSSENKLKSALSVLQRLGVEGRVLSELVGKQPRLLTTSEDKVMESFKQAEDLGFKLGSKMFAVALRSVFGIGKETLERRLQCLSSLGFSKQQISEMSNRHPTILGLSDENLKRHADFLVNSAGLTLADLVKYPRMFGFSLEKRVIPRYRVMEALKSMQMLKTKMHFRAIVCLTETRFLDIYVDSNPESSVLRDIYHCVKAGMLSIDKETSSESDVGPRLEAMHESMKAVKASIDKETRTESDVGMRLGHGESHS